MADRGATTVVPTLRPEDTGMELRPWSKPEDFNAGYVLRYSTRCSGRANASRGPT